MERVAVQRAATISGRQIRLVFHGYDFHTHWNFVRRGWTIVHPISPHRLERMTAKETAKQFCDALNFEPRVPSWEEVSSNLEKILVLNRNNALEEAAQLCDVTPEKIRALKTS